jgi:NMD protein affecting ribosome stability and mRNA decay
VNEKVMCPKCGARYDVIGETASKVIDRLCAACWSDQYQRNIPQGEAGKPRKNRRPRPTES